MTLYQFKALTQQEQYQTVWDEGVYLTDRIVYNNRFALYQIDSFYVELIYNTDENKIISIKSFLSTDLLEPYLDKIAIEFNDYTLQKYIVKCRHKKGEVFNF